MKNIPLQKMEGDILWAGDYSWSRKYLRSTAIPAANIGARNGMKFIAARRRFPLWAKQTAGHDREISDKINMFRLFIVVVPFRFFLIISPYGGCVNLYRE